jgi:dipeptidyl aminopeptidase/acylaminoacyl peptidase
MMGYVWCLLFLAAGPSAEAPRFIRKPVAAYLVAQPKEGANSVHTAALSPDGKLVAYVRGGQLTVYAVGQTRPLFTTKAGVVHGTDLAFSRDGKLLALAGKDRRVEIVAARTGKPRAAARLTRVAASVDALTFSPDGRQLAVAAGVLYHKDLHVFDTATGKVLGQPLDNVDGAAHQLLYAADGKRLVANHYFTIYLVDAGSYRLRAKVAAKAPVVFFRENKLYAVQEGSGALREVTAAGLGQKRVGRFADEVDTSHALRAAVAGQGGVAAIPVGQEVSVRTIEGRERFRVIGERSPVRRLRLSGDGRVLLVYRGSLRVEVFRLE